MFNFFMGLQVHIADGIEFVRGLKTSAAADEVSSVHGIDNVDSNVNLSSDGSCTKFNGTRSHKVDILIIDVDSSDSRYFSLFQLDALV